MASKSSSSSSHAKCPDCNFATKSPQDLFNHIKEKHTVPAPPPSPPAGPLPVRKNQKKCFICKKSFPKADECYQHISRLHGLLNCSCRRCTKKTDQHKFLVRSMAKDGDQQFDVFKCVLCTNAFLGLCRALVHCSEEHIEDPFECAQCNSTYKTYRDLSKHMATHLEEGQSAPLIQARCSYCKSGAHTGTKFFKRPLDLYKHMVEVHNYEEEQEARKKFEATHKAKFPHLYRNVQPVAPPATSTRPDPKPAAKDNQSDTDSAGQKSKGKKRGRPPGPKSRGRPRRGEPVKEKPSSGKEKSQEAVQIPCSLNCNLTFKSFMSFKNHMVTFHKMSKDHESLAEVGKQYGYEDKKSKKDPEKSSDDDDMTSSDDDWAPGAGGRGSAGTRRSKRVKYTRATKPSKVSPVPSPARVPSPVPSPAPVPSPVPSPEPVASPAGSGASSDTDVSSLTSTSSPLDTNAAQQPPDDDNKSDVAKKQPKQEPDDDDDDKLNHNGAAQNQVPCQAAPSPSISTADESTGQSTPQKPPPGSHGENENCTATNCEACKAGARSNTTLCKIVIKKEPLDYPLPSNPGATTQYMSDSNTLYVSQNSGVAASPYSASLPVAGTTSSYPTTSANVEDRCVQCLSNTTAKNICHHCGLIFLDPDVYTLHKLWHDREDPFKCSYCGKSCGSRYLFTTHIFRDPHP